MNTMFLVCTHHPTAADSFHLGARVKGSGYKPRDVGLERGLRKWLDTHSTCGGGYDHFTIAFELPKDGDLLKVDPIANGVHVALTEVGA